MSDQMLKQWQEYRTRAMHKKAPSIQVKECRLAFYSGALSIIRVMLDQVMEELTEEQAARNMEDLHREISETLMSMVNIKQENKH